MKIKDTQTTQQLCRSSRSSSRLAGCHATVIGLGGIGRQVALQLAALDVGRLQLIDTRKVVRTTQAAEGYARDDIGRPKAHAAAQLCHQINPTLDIETLHRRLPAGLDLGDAVFWCAGPGRLRRLLDSVKDRPISFLACCDVDNAVICIRVARDARLSTVCAKTRDWLKPRKGGESPSAVPIHMATVAAGLIMIEFTRFVAGRPPNRLIRFDVHRLNLKVVRPP